MGLFKKITNVVTAPAKAAAKTVKNVAQGNISDAAKSAVSSVTALSPVSMAENLSGGKLSQFSSAIPIVGSPISKFASASGTIGGSSGNYSGKTLRQYGREGLKLAAIGAGGYFAAPALGVGGTLTAGSVGSQLFSGDLRGALQSGINSYVPGEYSAFGGIASSLLQKRAPSSVPTEYPNPSGGFMVPSDGPSILAIAGLAIGAILIIKHARKK